MRHTAPTLTATLVATAVIGVVFPLIGLVLVTVRIADAVRGVR